MFHITGVHHLGRHELASSRTDLGGRGWRRMLLEIRDLHSND